MAYLISSDGFIGKVEQGRVTVIKQPITTTKVKVSKSKASKKKKIK